VTLRELTAADVAAVTVACRDPEIVRWTTEIPENYMEEDARQWIESTLAGWKRGNAEFAITDRATDSFAGAIGHSLGRTGWPKSATGSPRRFEAVDLRLVLSDWSLSGAIASVSSGCS